MTENEIRRQITQNSAAMKNGTDASKALLQTENESLAKQLDSMTGGTSAYDAGTGTWNLSASNKGAVDRYLDARSEVESSVYTGYDPTQDSSYQALKKQYMRQADRSTANVLGEYAGQTGGFASTAAIAAAQQSGDYFRGQLADKQVELADQDYTRYQNELSQKNSLMSAYATQAENAAKQLAALGDFSEMAKLYGWSSAQQAAAENAFYASQASSSGGGGGGGGSSSSSSSSETVVDGMTESEIIAKCNSLIDKLSPAQAINAIQTIGLTASQKEIAKTYMNAVLGSVDTSPKSTSSYSKQISNTGTTSTKKTTSSGYQQQLSGDTTWLKSIGVVNTPVSSKGKL